MLVEPYFDPNRLTQKDIECEVHRAEKLLADCVVLEHKKRANLHRFKAQQMQDSVDQMDLNVRWINVVVN